MNVKVSPERTKNGLRATSKQYVLHFSRRREFFYQAKDAGRKCIIRRDFMTKFPLNGSVFTLDWLVDRRHCTLKWQQSAASVKDMVNVAMQDISNVEEVKEILSGSGENCTLLRSFGLSLI